MTDNYFIEGCLIRKAPPDLIIKRKDGSPLSVDTIQLDNYGNIDYIISIEGERLYSSEINFYPNVLEIKGIGFLTPNTKVTYEKHDYLLKYGWHTNISNQTIYSWYLHPIEDSQVNYCDKTVYYEMLDHIEIIKFENIGGHK